MGKPSKATKKFQSKHLKRTLDQRREDKKHNQKIKGRRGNKTAEQKRAAALTKEDQKIRKSAKEEVFKDLAVEEFFDKGIELPKENKKLKKTKKEEKDENGSSSSESDSEDDDSEKDMEANMAALSKEDPEFYQYLKQNDKDLLDFTASNPLDNVEDEQSGDESEKEEPIVSDKIELTLPLVRGWKKELREKPNLKLLRNVVSAFKVAVNMNDSEALEKYRYTLTDEKAFHELMFIALKGFPQAVQKLVPYKENKGSRTIPTGKDISKVSSIIKSHAASLLTLLNDITNTETAAMVLHSVNELMPFLISYRRILKEIIKSIIEVWATTRDLETQIAAFAFLHNASKEFKKAILELVLKTTYSTFIKSCRKTNARSMPLINFQKNSAAELFGIDEVLGYQIGFENVRQLAIHLRNTLTATSNKTNKVNPTEAYKIVYNWQFCHSLDFWSRVLSFSCNPEKEQNRESPLRQLIYPLVQVTIGTARLIPTPQFFPLRFYLVRSLIRLSQNTGVFIPLFPIISEILTSTAFTKSPKKGENLEAFDFDHNIKCTAAYLGSKMYQEGLTEQLIDLLGEYFVLYSKSVSFPELATPVIISLRRYVKTSRNIKLNKQLSNVIEKLNQNVKYVEDKRSDVDFSPSNNTEANRFLNDVAWDKTPLGAFVKVQREVKEEKARLLRESLEEADKEKEELEKKQLEEEEDFEMSD